MLLMIEHDNGDDLTQPGNIYTTRSRRVVWTCNSFMVMIIIQFPKSINQLIKWKQKPQCSSSTHTKYYHIPLIKRWCLRHLISYYVCHGSNIFVIGIDNFTLLTSDENANKENMLFYWWLHIRKIFIKTISNIQ